MPQAYINYYLMSLKELAALPKDPKPTLLLHVVFFLRQQFLRHVNDLPQLALRPEGKSHFFNKRIGRNRLGNKVVRPDFVKQHDHCRSPERA